MNVGAIQTRQMVVKRQHYTVCAWKKIPSTTQFSDVEWNVFRWYYSGEELNWRMERSKEQILQQLMRFVDKWAVKGWIRYIEFDYDTIAYTNSLVYKNPVWGGGAFG